MPSHRLDRLRELAVLLADTDLGNRLGELARLAAQATDAAACSIMLLSGSETGSARLKLWTSTADLPPAAWNELPGWGEAIAGRVLESGQPRLVADIRQSEFAALARRRDGLGASFLCIPIAVGEQMIGVVNLSSRPDGAAFDDADLVTGQIVAALIAKSIQVRRLETLLRSRVAQASLAREAPHVTSSLTGGTLPPSRLAKVLAKSFYKDLSAAGFEPGQIIEAASEIIAQISEDVARHKRRMARGR